MTIDLIKVGQEQEHIAETLQQVTVLIGIAYKVSRSTVGDRSRRELPYPTQGSIVGGVVHQPWHPPSGEGRTVWAMKVRERSSR